MHPRDFAWLEPVLWGAMEGEAAPADAEEGEAAPADAEEREAAPADAEEREAAQAEPEDEWLWVKCSACQKWRRLRLGASPPPRGLWVCSMNDGDEGRAFCAAPEEVWDSSRETVVRKRQHSAPMPGARKRPRTNSPPARREKPQKARPKAGPKAKAKAKAQKPKAKPKSTPPTLEAEPERAEPLVPASGRKRRKKGYEDDCTWVMCSLCGKWRRLGYAQDNLTGEWVCAMNEDAARASCQVPEEAFDEAREVVVVGELNYSSSSAEGGSSGSSSESEESGADDEVWPAWALEVRMGAVEVHLLPEDVWVPACPQGAPSAAGLAVAYHFPSGGAASFATLPPERVRQPGTTELVVPRGTKQAWIEQLGKVARGPAHRRERVEQDAPAPSTPAAVFDPEKARRLRELVVQQVVDLLRSGDELSDERAVRTAVEAWEAALASTVGDLFAAQPESRKMTWARYRQGVYDAKHVLKREAGLRAALRSGDRAAAEHLARGGEPEHEAEAAASASSGIDRAAGTVAGSRKCVLTDSTGL